MTPSTDCVTNDREYNLKLRISDGSTVILTLSFRPEILIDLLLNVVAHVPDLRFRMHSLPTLPANGHIFGGRPTGGVVRLASERSIMFPFSGTLFSLFGYRVDSGCRENVFVALPPGQPPSRSSSNIYDFHCAGEHSHDLLLRKTTEQLGNTLEGELQGCEVKRENKSQAKAQECVFLGPARNDPRGSVRMLTRRRIVLITRNIARQRVSPAPPVPAQMNVSMPMEEGGSIADDDSKSDRGGGGDGRGPGQRSGSPERSRRHLGFWS